MKNRINFKPILAFSFGLAGTFIFLTACSDNKSGDTREITENGNLNNQANGDDTILVVKNDPDNKFLMEAAEMQLEEISLGQLAQQKGTSDHVKDLGKMMEENHTKSLSELRSLAQNSSIAIPTEVNNNARGNYDDLNEKSGVEFGKSYSELMVEHHEDAIDLFEDASEDAEDMEIRNWATNQLVSLRAHLGHAEACKLACEKM